MSTVYILFLLVLPLFFLFLLLLRPSFTPIRLLALRKAKVALKIYASYGPSISCLGVPGAVLSKANPYYKFSYRV